MSGAIALIQARMGSERLPGKVLMDIAGRPMVEHVLRRAAAAPGVERVILCLSDAPEDEPLQSWALASGRDFAVADGMPPTDVLGRFAAAVASLWRVLDTPRGCFSQAQGLPLDTLLVRLTADCPLIDPMLITRAIQTYRAADDNDPLFTATTPDFGWPDGQDVEVFGVATLLNAGAAAIEPADREHVTPWMRRCASQWPLWSDAMMEDTRLALAAAPKMSVDIASELAFARRVHEALGPGLWGLPAILDYLKRTGDKP